MKLTVAANCVSHNRNIIGIETMELSYFYDNSNVHNNK
jgi:hypothetical protein